MWSINSAGVVRFGPLRFWAERGLIHVEDSRDNSYDSFAVRIALERMRALSEMLGNSSSREKHSEDRFDQAERKRIQDMIDGMVNITQKAREQGMPSDPSAVRDLARRRPLTLVVTDYSEVM